MEWISVKDRLPECDEKYGVSKIVFVCDAWGRTGFGIYQNAKQLIHPCWFTGGKAGDDAVRIDYCTPIPKPPNGDAGNG